MEAVPLHLVEYFMKCGLTYEDISEELCRRYPGVCGLSARSVRRYCKVNGVTHLNTQELEQLAEEAILEVGSVYGRRLMKGFLLSKGFRVSEHRVAMALHEVAPHDYEARRNDTLDRTNPVPYHACHFGHKIHLDQNEKLVMFGVTSVIARDGFSGKIVSYGVMPMKNNLAIYDLVYRKALVEHGLWHQVRVDHGREFYLVLNVQEQLRSTRGPVDITAYVQSPSTENLTVERMWPEINSRVNYPIKRVLIAMTEAGLINLDDDVHKFCVSFVTCGVVHVGLTRFINAWNHHSIPGKGVPEVLAGDHSHITHLHIWDIPDVNEAVAGYIREGGSLQQQSLFGIDPIADRIDLVGRRDNILRFLNPTTQDTFTNVVSGNGHFLKYSISNCIKVTYQLSRSLY